MPTNEKLSTLLIMFGCIGVLAGYLRLISDDKGNVPLLNYRLTGCLGAFLSGVYDGTRDIIARQWSPESLSAAMVYGGIALFILGVRVV